MPARSVRLVLAVFCAASTLVACQSVETTTTPAPTFTCTPEAGGDSFACSQFQYDEMRAKDALYAEAELVYRKFLAEDVRIMRAGGVTEPTPVLLETTTGAFLEDALADYRQLAADGTKAYGAQPKIMYVKRAPGRSKSGSLISVDVCVDGTGLEFLQGEKRIGDGQAARDATYFARFEDSLKIIGADGEQVESCASQ